MERIAINANITVVEPVIHCNHDYAITVGNHGPVNIHHQDAAEIKYMSKCVDCCVD